MNWRLSHFYTFKFSAKSILLSVYKNLDRRDIAFRKTVLNKSADSYLVNKKVSLTLIKNKNRKNVGRPV